MQPSDFFGQEILPECTFESEYGKLTLGKVIVPDFSSDENGAVHLKEEFNNLKSFIEEKDLSKKGDIADQVYKNELSRTDFCSQSSEAPSQFFHLLKASMRARLFETGCSLDPWLCSEFGYNYNSCLASGIVSYNDNPVIQPFSCAGGVYAYCLKYVLNPDIFCPPDYYDLRDEILTDGAPIHNYLSWAFACASVNKELISFVSDVHIGLN